jgi:predicted lactoylglutathione lyase
MVAPFIIVIEFYVNRQLTATLLLYPNLGLTVNKIYNTKHIMIVNQQTNIFNLQGLQKYNNFVKITTTPPPIL